LTKYFWFGILKPVNENDNHYQQSAVAMDVVNGEIIIKSP
jgi:hypothetical protein